MSKATTQTWNINGIEFQAVASVEEGSLLKVGLVQNPDHGKFFFDRANFGRFELAQLVDEGWLERCFPQWLGLAADDCNCFCLRLVVDDVGNFIDGSEPADCIVCKRAFPFIDNGDNMIMTAPATGPSFAGGGDPADWDSACTECIEAGPEEEEYPEEYDEDFWDEPA